MRLEAQKYCFIAAEKSVLEYGSNKIGGDWRRPDTLLPDPLVMVQILSNGGPDFGRFCEEFQ